MRLASLAIVVSLSTLQCARSIPHAEAQTPPTTPSTPSMRYPEAPQQRSPWSGSTAGLSSAWNTNTVQQLFSAGIADPRGLPYHEVQLRVGSVWTGDAGLVTTHAFVLPASPTDRQRYAIAWNGITYPVEQLGAEVPLRADLDRLAALRHDAPAREDVSPEAFSVLVERQHTVRVALLIRLGEVRTAVAFQQHAHNGRQLSPSEIATHWSWSLYERALTAHMRGDDRNARACAELLEQAQTTLQALLPSPLPNDVATTFGQLHTLAEEQRRRAAQPATFDLARVQAMTDPAQRVAALVRGLEFVSARQDGQPGGVALASDPIVQALIREGEAAVEPLIDVFERDQRLTRSVHFWRDFATSRTILGVHEAAYVALSNILEADFFSPRSTGDNLTAHGAGGRTALASQIRAAWHRWRGVSRSERWYRTLADDDAGVQRWLESAQQIVQDSNTTVQRGSMVFVGSVSRQPAGDAGVTMRGEALRTHAPPSVSALIERRAMQQLEAATRTNQPFVFREREGEACVFGKVLTLWDPVGTRTTVQTIWRRLEQSTRGRATPELLGRCLAELAELRHRAGDPHALDEYAAFTQTLQASTIQDHYVLRSMLRPFAEHPTHPSLQAAAARLFDGATPTMWPRMDHADGIPNYLYGLLEDPLLLRIPAFAGMIDRALQSSLTAARLHWLGPRNYQIDYHNASNGGALEENEPPPTNRSDQSLRLSDWVAMHLSRVSSPHVAFGAHWDEARRNEGLTRMRAYVQAQRSAR